MTAAVDHSRLFQGAARDPRWTSALDHLGKDGFAVVEAIATPADIALIREAMLRVMGRSDVTIRELGERGGVPQIQEVHHIASRAPEILGTEFYRRAKEFSETYLRKPVHLKFDHVILKPPMSNKETAWHQDSTYAPRFWRYHSRVHWWLPLHDVSVEQGCLQYVPGTQNSARMKHVPVSPASDAVRTFLPEGATVVPCPVKAGSACVHLPRTLHCTGPNVTDRPREAFILQFAATSALPRYDW